MARVPRCIAITDRLHEFSPEEVGALVRPLLAQGLPAVLLRAKGLSEAELVPMGELLRGLTTEAGAQLIVHGSVRAALRFRADGVHFPSSALANDREDVPPSLATGYSCHSRPELLQAIRRGATYAFLSPYSAPRSHETDLPALGASGFREAINGLPIPVLALGGMTPPLAREAMDAGAYGVAAITGLFHPGADCREWLDAVRAGDE